MTLEKLKIKPLSPSKLEPFFVQFNPAHYAMSKSVRWGAPAPPTTVTGSCETKATRKLNAPMLVYQGGQSRVLSMQLFFDVTEQFNIDGPPVTDVRKLTNKFVALTRKERAGNKDQPPPVCEIEWGGSPLENADFPFKGVVTSLSQDYVLFAPDGTPLRANLTVSFTEFLSSKEDQLETDPEFTTRVAKRGDTLSRIASEMYGDPALWRVIADANRLDDPRRLEVGRTLHIPKIT
jgi:nucleoid-associated protein YgaU